MNLKPKKKGAKKLVLKEKNNNPIQMNTNHQSNTVPNSQVSQNLSDTATTSNAQIRWFTAARNNFPSPHQRTQTGVTYINMLKNSPTGNKRSQVVADLSTIHLGEPRKPTSKSTQKIRPQTAISRKFNNTTTLKEPDVRQITLIKKKVNVKGKKR